MAMRRIWGGELSRGARQGEEEEGRRKTTSERGQREGGRREGREASLALPSSLASKGRQAGKAAWLPLRRVNEEPARKGL